jgi:hypothetical protein
VEPLTEQTGRELLRELKRYNNLHGNPKNKCWVKVSVIRDLTGWDRERMRRARNNGEVEFKKDGNKFLYNPDSIHPVHKKLKVA